MKKREIIEFIETVDEVDLAESNALMTDEDALEFVAFVYLSPGRFFRLWVRSLAYRIRHALKYHGNR